MVKITDLARELRCSSTAVWDMLADLGVVGVTVSAATLNTIQANRVRQYFNSKSELIGRAKSVASRFGEEI